VAIPINSGIRVMLNEMKDALKSPAALAFLAQAFKDVGYVIPSLDLYAQTVDVLKSTQGTTFSVKSHSCVCSTKFCGIMQVQPTLKLSTCL
jgi:hypothetical protein